MKYIDEYIYALDSKSCGQDLEYSAEFIELERLVRGGDTVEYGEHVYASEPVDWGRVEKLCRELYENTLDLRVVVILTRSLLERYGFNGFIGGLRLVSCLLHQRWENVHPQLVAEDQFDPLIRINTLAELAVPATIIVALKRQVLATTEEGEVLYLADLDIICSAEGAVQGERRELLNKLINPNCSTELMRSLGQVNAIHSALNEMTLYLEEKTAIHGISPLQNMSNSLRRWARVVEDQLRIVTPKLPVAASREWGVSMQPKPVSSEHTANRCESREDAIRALDAICAYYQQQEPSSPVPFLLSRVRRVATMNFINIITELAPDALADLRRLGESSTD